MTDIKITRDVKKVVATADGVTVEYPVTMSDAEIKRHFNIVLDSEAKAAVAIAEAKELENIKQTLDVLQSENKKLKADNATMAEANKTLVGKLKAKK